MDALYKQLTESEMSMIKARLLAWQEHGDISWIMRTHGDINYALHALFMLSCSGVSFQSCLSWQHPASLGYSARRLQNLM